MKILSAEFVVSAPDAARFPHSVLPEVAFAGKSNVGKSSLINCLLHRRNLVKTSARPGKTQMINFFRVNGRFHLVDLPGYGFARAPKAVQAGWARLVEGYLTSRKQLRGLVLIVDIRHAPSPLDVQMTEWLHAIGRPYIVAANKSDQVSALQASRQVQEIAQILGLAEPPLLFSARKGTGREALWARIAPWLGG